jgi:hypothetical protein
MIATGIVPDRERKPIRRKDYTPLVLIIPTHSNIVKKKNSLFLQIHKLLPTTQRLHLELARNLPSKLNTINLLNILILLILLHDITLPLLARRGKVLHLLVIDIVVELLGLARGGSLGCLWGSGGAGDAVVGAGVGGFAELLEVLAGWVLVGSDVECGIIT